MKLLILFAQLLSVAPLGDNDISLVGEEWNLFKTEYNKIYNTEKEEELRKRTFHDNLSNIKKHNEKYKRGEVTYDLGVNQFADMTSEEYEEEIAHCAKFPDTAEIENTILDVKDIDWNSPVDWRDKGAVTEVKQQGLCGSCWAFSVTGSLEGHVFLSNKSEKKNLISFSEQNLIDCSADDHGCNGNNLHRAFQYIKDNKGIDTEESYPYEGIEKKCRYNANNSRASITGYKSNNQGAEVQLQAAVKTIGPISVIIDASGSFQFYRTGVFVNPHCSAARNRLNHAVLVVGYGTDKAEGDYWIVKNSWGAIWGKKGYIWMARNQHNMCGIATYFIYPSSSPAIHSNIYLKLGMFIIFVINKFV